MTEKEELKKFIEENPNAMKARTILVIKSRPLLAATEDGAELNEGYEFEVNAALPEIADGIVKLAMELENNGFGEGSNKLFIQLINEFFNKLNEQ